MHLSQRRSHAACVFALGLSTAMLLPSVLLPSLANAGRGKGKKHNKTAHKYHGGHPLSVRVDDGFCFIEVPHVHATRPPKAHKALYRDHRGHHSFVADPAPYGYDGPSHTYYGHHPVAVEVILGEAPSYASGQQLEFCYLDGPHVHSFEPPKGLHFEVEAGASWYIGELPDTYVQGKVRFAPVNRVYARLEVERPQVVFETPPKGYLGPIVQVNITAPAAVLTSPGHGHGHGDAHGHAEIRAGVEIHVPTPRIEIGVSLPGVSITHDHHHEKKHKHGHKHRRGKKHGHGHKKKGGRAQIKW